MAVLAPMPRASVRTATTVKPRFPLSVRRVLLKPLPYRDPDRLVWITENNVTNSNNLAMIFASDLQEWRAQACSFDAMGALLTGDATLSGENAVQVRFVSSSESLTRLFGVSPVLGRDFMPEDLEDGPQAPGLRVPSTAHVPTGGVSILSDRLFRQRFGGDPRILGKGVVIQNVPYTVIGVLPSTFRFPVAPTLQLGIGPQIDVDVVLNTTLSPTYRGPGALLARLKPAVELDTARNWKPFVAPRTSLVKGSGLALRITFRDPRRFEVPLQLPLFASNLLDAAEVEVVGRRIYSEPDTLEKAGVAEEIAVHPVPGHEQGSLRPREIPLRQPRGSAARG